MTLTVTDRGTGTSTGSASPLTAGGRNATIPAGSLAVLCITVDNSGDSVPAGPWTFIDSVGNVWVRMVSKVSDHGASQTGLDMAFYGSQLEADLLTSDTVTLTWFRGTPIGAVWTWYQVDSSGGDNIVVKETGVSSTATTNSASLTTGTVDVGEAVIGAYSIEQTASITADADTTNGNWSAHQTVTVGAGTGGLRISTQSKVQTTTPSTQTYNCSTASNHDRAAVFVVLAEETPPVLPVEVIRRGTGAQFSDTGSLTPGGRSGTIAAGSTGVLCITVDNTGDFNTTFPASFTDSVGNTWTRRMVAALDGGASSAGLDSAIYVSHLTADLLTSDSMTINFTIGTPDARAWAWWEIKPDPGDSLSFVTSGSSSGLATSSGTVTTGTIPVDDIVVAQYAMEFGNLAIVGDLDTTNGRWSLPQFSRAGTGTAGVAVQTQVKVQQGTGSTQSYSSNTDNSNTDHTAAYVHLHLEQAAVAVGRSFAAVLG